MTHGGLDKDILSEVPDEITVLRVGVNVALMTVIRLNQSGISTATGVWSQLEGNTKMFWSLFDLGAVCVLGLNYVCFHFWHKEEERKFTMCKISKPNTL